jgi:hypothetical protein
MRPARVMFGLKNPVTHKEYLGATRAANDKSGKQKHRDIAAQALKLFRNDFSRQVSARQSVGTALNDACEQ